MSTQIATYLLKQGGGLLWNNIKGGLFKEAEKHIGDVLAAQEILLSSMTSMHFEALIWSSVVRIKYWTKELKRALELEKEARLKPGNKAPPLPFLTKDMRKLEDAIGSMGEGVGFHMENIIAAITGENALGGRGGLLNVWNAAALDKLCDADNLNYTIKDYLLEIEGNLTAAAKLLRDAHELHVLVADDDEERTAWATALAATIKDIQTRAWALFPTALKTLKPSYTSPFVSTDHWWRFESSARRGSFLAMRKPAFRGHPVEFISLGPCPPSEWRFDGIFAQLDGDGVVADSDRGVSRLVRLRCRKGEDFFGAKFGVGWIAAPEGAAEFVPVVIKIVPVRDTAEAKVLFAVKRQTTGEMRRENGKGGYFGTQFSEEFLLRDEGVLQSGFVAPAEEAGGCVVM